MGSLLPFAASAMPPAPLRRAARGVGLDDFDNRLAGVAACQEFDEGLGGVL